MGNCIPQVHKKYHMKILLKKKIGQTKFVQNLQKYWKNSMK